MMKFIDAHMHFWDRSLMPYTWLHEVPAIWDRHTFENLQTESHELPEKVVFVEAGAPWREETNWVESLAKSEPRIAGIVSKIAINAGPQTAADIAEPDRHPLVHGVRHHFEHDPIDYCARPEFIAGVRQLVPAELSFDICCKHPQLPAVIELVRRCPETQFILDHAGKPAIRDRLLDPWRTHIRILSTFSNIVCKFSGLVTEADHNAWTPDDLLPYVTVILETFGPSRMLFGGDWPVAKLASSYQRWLDTARDFLSDLSPAKQQAIFFDNAARVYRL